MQKLGRKSGIEMLKVLAVLAIVLSHLCQTLSCDNIYIDYSDYVLALNMATKDVQMLVLSIFRYGGTFGNTVFFICSCWFLLDSKKTSLKKIAYMLIDIWIISVVILIVSCAVLGGAVNVELIIKSFFPTFFSNNWYLTCYMLFYGIHSFLNQIIYGLDQKWLLKVSIVLSFLYIFCNFIKGCFEFSNIILWITIYFCVAYMKLYLKNLVSSKKINVELVIVGFIGNLVIILVTNCLGLYFPFFQDRLLHWNRMANPFLIMATIGLFNLSRLISYQSRFVNGLSGLSLYVYIIHDNILIRTYFRPFLFHFIYQIYGYDYILLWVLLLTVSFFAISVIVSWLYQRLMKRFVKMVGDTLFTLLCRGYAAAENILLKYH